MQRVHKVYCSKGNAASISHQHTTQYTPLRIDLLLLQVRQNAGKQALVLVCIYSMTGGA
jgi:hypothetical protein